MSITVAESDINYIVTTPVNADIDNLVITSSNTAIATVEQDEENPRKITVTGVAIGEATITATLGELSDTCAVTINLPEATAISWQHSSLTINENASVDNNVITVPENADISNLEVTSSDTTVATVTPSVLNPRQIRISGLTAGTSNIVATIGELTATCIVTVTSP